MKSKICIMAVLCLCAVMVFGTKKADNSGTSDGGVIAEIKEAQAFLATIYAMPNKVEVERAVGARVKIGDSVLTHRGLLSEAMHTQYNPYSNRFVFTYYQSGKTPISGAQGFWVVTIESDAQNRLAEVRVGIAKH